MRKLLALLLPGVALLAPAAAAARAESIVALIGTGSLITFDGASPGTVSTPVAITGLLDGDNEVVAGIDFRPADGALVAFTRGIAFRGRVYTVDPLTGAATLISGANGLRDASNNEVRLSDPNPFNYGVDFNPVANALRVVNSSDQNLRITLGGAGVTTVDTPLNGPGTRDNPNVSAIAYSNNSPGATSTTLYALDDVTERLRTIGGLGGVPSPNTGQVSDVGPLTPFNPAFNFIGFDISGATGIAYASFANNNDFLTRLFTVNLATGETTLLGSIGSDVIVTDISVMATPSAIPEPSSLTLMAIGAVGLGGFVRWRRKAG
jgi:hypothetical protein